MTQKKRDRRGRDRAAEKQPYPRFLQHKNNAEKRGVAWGFTFEEWHQMWLDSGKWGERGYGSNKYCMARFGDVGPYSKDNVYICTNFENMSTTARSKKVMARLGCGKGWFKNSRSSGKPYVVQFNQRHVAAFATQEEAESLYRRLVAQTIEELGCR